VWSGRAQITGPGIAVQALIAVAVAAAFYLTERRSRQTAGPVRD
jgi:hypothetical protein